MNKVSEIMIKELVCCTPLTKIEESKRIMKKYECSKIPVVNSFKDRKIIGAVALEDLLKKKKVIHCMSKNLKAVEEDSTIDECLRVMIMNNMEQVPVIDKQGHFCGIVTEQRILMMGKSPSGDAL